MVKEDSAPSQQKPIFRVAPQCHDLGLRAGAIVFRRVQVGPAPEDLRREIRQAATSIQARFPDPASARGAPEIAAYRDVLRRVGANPRREQNSVDRLVGFALKRGVLPAINSLVDAYNLISLRTLCSLGAHDLDRIALPVELRLLTGTESFTPLGRSQEEKSIPGEFGYVDAQNRLLCRLDVLQADFSKVTPASRNVLVIIEGTTAHPAEKLLGIFQDVVELVCRYCGGQAEMVLPYEPRP